ncbi:hypothetical protein [Paenibacillus sp. 7516]|uniref:hypothetical protein n=1 Tax=Paenibacillus sp. 7516 TaxID=2022549 RepID=UPI001482C536|nr:hypothetical protein [Paenibacillus sp. 7516]
MLHSDRMPEIPAGPPISDLFANLALNWSTLMPVLAILFGTIFGTWLLMKVKRNTD